MRIRLELKDGSKIMPFGKYEFDNPPRSDYFLLLMILQICRYLNSIAGIRFNSEFLHRLSCLNLLLISSQLHLCCIDAVKRIQIQSANNSCQTQRNALPFTGISSINVNIFVGCKSQRNDCRPLSNVLRSTDS